MKKTFAKLLTLMLASAMCLMCFTACGNKGNEAEGTQQGEQSGAEGEEPAADQTLKIGGIGPLTGGAASYGQSVKNGAEIAIAEINANGGVNGIKLALEFQDDEADGAKAKLAYEKLMDNGMQVLMGAVTSGASVALNDLTKSDGILQITPSGSQKECTDNANSFRICFTDPLQGEEMAKYCYNELKYTKAAIIYNQDDSYSKGIYDAFVEVFTGLGGTISSDTSFANDANDFNAQLTKIQSTDAEFIFMPIYNDKAAQIAIAANDKDIKLPMVGCDGWDGILEKYLDGDKAALVEGAIYLTPFVASDPNEAIQAFVKAYSEKFDAAPDQFAADAYDAIYTIKAAMEKAAIKDVKDKELNKKLVSAMTGITVDGLTGEMTFNENGEPNKGAKVAKIVNGEYVAQ